MRKIRYVLFALLMIFIAPIMTACAEDIIPVDGVEFTESTFTLTQNSSLQLTYKLLPLEATNKDVSFNVVSGGEYISVDKNGIVSAGVIADNKAKVAVVAIRTDYGKHEAKCNVKILPQKIVLDIPTNIRYDKETNSVVWDVVTFKDTDTSDSKIPDYNPNYYLSISRNGEAFQNFPKLKAASYKITQSGKYVVRVRSQSNKQEVFADSDFGQEYQFTVYDTPETPVVENNKITVRKVDSSSTKDDYAIEIIRREDNQKLSDQLMEELYGNASEYKTETETTVSWEIPSKTSDIFKEGTYDCKVMVVGDDVSTFNSQFSQTTTFYQLGSPNELLISNNVLSWEVIKNATAYKIIATYKTSENKDKKIEETVISNTWNLPSELKDKTNIHITVQALGNGLEIISGGANSQLKQKLQTPTNIKIENRVLSWDIVAGAKTYRIMFNDSEKIISDNSPTSFILTEDQIRELNVGENIVKIYAIPEVRVLQEDEDVNDYVNYEKSEAGEIVVTKLATPVLKTKGGEITWNEITWNENNSSVAAKYKLNITPKNETMEEIFNGSQTSYSFLNTDDKTYNAGEIKVKIKALGNDGNVLDGETSEEITFVKQSAPENLQVSETGLLEWTMSENYYGSTNYEVDVINASSLQTEVVINATQNYCSVLSYLSQKGYGKYLFAVRAVNNLSLERYLNSELSSSILTYKLESPKNMKIEEGKLAWEGITNQVEGQSFSLKYDVEIDNESNVQISYDTNLTPSRLNAGNHKARVRSGILGSNEIIAKNGAKIFLVSSSYTDKMNFTKIATPSTPQIKNAEVFGPVIKGVTSYTITLSKVKASEDEQEVPDYSQSIDVNVDVWNITITQLFSFYSNTSPGKYLVRIKANGGSEYVSSEQSAALALYQLETPNLRVENGVLKWDIVWSVIDNHLSPIKNYVIEYQNSDGTGKTLSYVPDEGETSWNMKGLYGSYKVWIKAVASADNHKILSSKQSQPVIVEKMASINVNSIRLLNIEKNPTLNKITWDAVEGANYKLSLYQNLTTGPKFIETVDLSENIYEFSDSYTAENYYIEIQTYIVSPDSSSLKVSSDVPAKIKINRLPQVQSISISSDGVVSWSAVSSAYNYYLVKDDTNASIDKNTTTWDLMSVLGDQTGGIEINVVALVDSSNLNQVDGVLTIAGASSSKLRLIRYNAPTLTVNGGKITWSNSDNQTCQGYELTIDGDAISFKYQFDNATNSYDMSDSRLQNGIKYRVKIKARGNVGETGGIYLKSNDAVCPVYVQKLSSPKFKVKNGKLCWNAVEGASGYNVVVSSAEKTITTSSVTSEITGAETLIYLNPSELQGLDGQLRFTLQSVGTSSVETEQNVAYISSSQGDENIVMKHVAPSGLGVVDGEVNWTRHNAQYISIGSTSYQIIRGYSVSYGDGYAVVGEKQENGGLNEPFILSKHAQNKSVIVRVSTLGTDDGDGKPVGAVYLNSDYCSSISVVVNSAPTNLRVENGVIMWDDSSSIMGLGYSVEMLSEDGQKSFSVTTSLKSTTLNGNTEIPRDAVYTHLKVRHYGTSAYNPSKLNYVNSEYSDEIKSITLLPEAKVGVTEEGEFKWLNKLEFDKYASIAGITFSVNNVQVAAHEIKDVFVLDDDYSSTGNNYLSLNISGYIQGSLNSTSNYQYNGSLLVNGPNFDFSAYRFNPVKSFDISDGLKFKWDVDVISINGEISNNRYVIEYQLGDNIGTGEWKKRIVDEATEIPLWDLTRYKARIYVLSTSQNVIRSKVLDCAKTTTPFQFCKFESGNGTPENPFIISDTRNVDVKIPDGNETLYIEKTSANTKLEYVNIIPSAFFKLDCNIVLEESTNKATNFKNFNGNKDAYGTIGFSGGFDGNNHTISNYQIYQDPQGTALWTSLSGGQREGFTSTARKDNFYGRYGIIQNLKLEVANFNLPIYSTFSFFATESYGGWIIDCTLSANENIKLEKMTTTSEIIYGGFVGIMTTIGSLDDFDEEKAEKDKNYAEKFEYKDTRIVGCVSNINIEMSKSQDQLTSATVLAGIVGVNYGGYIYNCKNNGELTGTTVAGIAAQMNEVQTYQKENSEWKQVGYRSVISGCENNADLMCLPTTEIVSNSGGIVATLSSGDIVYSINRGKITAKSAALHSDAASTIKVAVTVGGLVGLQQNGFIVNSLFVGRVDASPNNSIQSPQYDPNPTESSESRIGTLVGNASGRNAIIKSYYASTDNTTFYACGNDETYISTEACSSEDMKQANFVSSSNFLSDQELNNKQITYKDDVLNKKPNFAMQTNDYPKINWA